MDVVGIILGLSAAIGQSAAFLLTRVFVIRKHQGAWHLFFIGHFLMAIIATVILPFIWPDNMPPFKTYAPYLITATFAYSMAQLTFYLTLKRDDASKVAPLLSLKIVMLAILSMIFLSVKPTVIQIVGMLMCVVGAGLLNYDPGQKAKASLITLVGILFTCCMFATSDLTLLKMLNILSEIPRLKASFIAVCLCYMICGYASIPALWFIRKEFVKDISFAFPYALLWLVAVAMYFGCLSLVGPVYGAMLQSTRGFISIILGFIVSAVGLVHIERKISKAAAIRRVIAVSVIIGGIVIYKLL